LPWESFAGVKTAYNGIPQVLVIAYANAPWDKRQIVKCVHLTPDLAARSLQECAQFAGFALIGALGFHSPNSSTVTSTLAASSQVRF
jgi:hypothetical protein